MAKKKLYFSLEGMECISCVGPVKTLLKEYKNKFHIYLPNHSLTIDIDDNQSEDSIRKEIQEKLAAYNCEFCKSEIIDSEDLSIDINTIVETDEDGEAVQDNKKNEVESKSSRRYKLILSIIKGVVGLVAGSVVMGLMLSGLAIPVYATYIIVFGGTCLTLVLGAESYWEAIKKYFTTQTLTMDTLFSISTLMAIGVSIANLFVFLMHGMIDAGLMIFGFRHIGKAVKQFFNEKIDETDLFEDRSAERVKKWREGKYWQEDFESRKLIRGNIIRVKEGDVIPVNGKCLSEKAYVKTTNINGNNNDIDVPLSKGDLVLSGMQVSQGNEIDILVSAPMSSSYLARLKKANENALYKKPSSLEETTQKILKYFIPAVLVFAIVTGILVGVFFPPLLAVQWVALVLVLICPCTLGLISSLAMSAQMIKARNQYNVMYTSNKSLEKGSDIDVVVFDYNGTMTNGSYDRVLNHHVFNENEMSKKDLLACLAVIEKQADHPMAAAIYAYAIKNNQDDTEVSDIKKPGVKIEKMPSGIQATIGDNIFLLGNKDLLEDKGVILPEIKNPDKDPGVKIIYLVRNKVAVGYVEVKDSPRPGAKFVIQKLQKMGKQVHVLSGDEADRAEYISKEYGIPIENICMKATALSEKNRVSKEEYIKDLQKNNKRVAVVGDGINDLLAMKQSDFSIAVTSPASVMATQKNASAIITGKSLLPVLSAFSISERTVKHIKKSIVMSLTYNVVIILIVGGILIGLGFVLNPAVGAALMIVQMMLMLGYLYYVLNKELPHERKYNDVLNNRDENDLSYKKMYKKGVTFEMKPDVPISQKENNNKLPNKIQKINVPKPVKTNDNTQKIRIQQKI